MKTPLLFFTGIMLTFSVSILSTSGANAQTTALEKSKISEEEAQALQGDVPFTIVDQMPSYVGGEDELLNHLRKAVPTARNQSGLGVYSFIVNRDGSISDVEVLKTLHAATDKEIAAALVATSGKWTPGQQHEYKVRIRYILPVRFEGDKLMLVKQLQVEPEDLPYTYVENMPDFIDGGRKGFLQRLDQAVPNQQNIQGISAFSFIVERDGTLSDIEMVSSVHPENETLLKAALQETSGQWSPGSQNGKLVRTRMTVSIKYPILGDQKPPVTTKSTRKSKKGN